MKIEKYSLLSLIDDSDKSIRDFDCQDVQINDFLHNHAYSSDKTYRTQTSLFYDKVKNALVGFYSTSVGLVEIRTPKDFKYFKNKGMISDDYIDGNLESIFMPALRLDYLGRDVQYRNQKIGKSMVYDLFKNFIAAYMEHGIGMSGILLDSTICAVDFYKKLGFEYLHREYSEEDLNTKPRKMFIDIKTVIDIKTATDSIV
ncbi:MAG: hypothetical protein ABF539_08050 [Liquorilactobacillus nagelii]|uniref:hypothetical protein n=1 Tax=Liquorilactobacillus nagelii TaxID=82688 RepID=UPI0039EB21B3